MIIGGRILSTVVGLTILQVLGADAAQPTIRAGADSDLMLSRPCKSSEQCLHTWTLTSRLGHILTVYEKALGPRAEVYRLLGIEFTKALRPRTWYPDFGDGPRNIIVQLTERARRNQKLALFQLGHEAFHLIAPLPPGTQSSVLEEGLASYFALAYMKQEGLTDGINFIARGPYRTAYDLVARIAQAYPDDFDARVRQLRGLRQSFSTLTADDIRSVFPKTPSRVVRELVRAFQ